MKRRSTRSRDGFTGMLRHTPDKALPQQDDARDGQDVRRGSLGCVLVTREPGGAQRFETQDLWVKIVSDGGGQL